MEKKIVFKNLAGDGSYDSLYPQTPQQNIPAIHSKDGTVHTFTTLYLSEMEDIMVFVSTYTSNYTAGDTITLKNEDGTVEYSGIVVKTLPANDSATNDTFVSGTTGTFTVNLGGATKYAFFKAGGADAPVLQDKVATPTTSSQIIAADVGYDALNQVTINATPLESKSATPSTSPQTIAPTAPNIGLLEVDIAAVSLQEKTVTPTTSQQILTPDSPNLGLSQVTVAATPLHTKTVTPTTGVQTVTPTAPNIGLSSVSVAATPLQSKSVTPSSVSQTITPDSPNIGLSSVIVGAITSSSSVKSIQRGVASSSAEFFQSGDYISSYVPPTKTVSFSTSIDPNYTLVLLENKKLYTANRFSSAKGFGSMLLTLSANNFTYKVNTTVAHLFDSDSTYDSASTVPYQIIEFFPSAVKKVYRGNAPLAGGTISIGGTVVPNKCFIILQPQALIYESGGGNVITSDLPNVQSISTTYFSIANASYAFTNAQIGWQLVEFN